MKIIGKIKDDDIFYSKGFLGIFWRRGLLVDSLQGHFKMKPYIVYEIDITEGNRFQIEDASKSLHYNISLIKDKKYDGYIGLVCKTEFNKLFFTPDPDKLYDIMVTEILKE